MAAPLKLCARLRWLPHTHHPTLPPFSTRPPRLPCWLSPARAAHVARALRLRGAPYTEEEMGTGRRNRNEMKREARKAVRLGMDLAELTPPQIKKILRAVSAEEEVYEALMLAKRLGPDVRDGKRRQFNYIGKLLRDVQPEFMDSLIKASKEHDHSKLQFLMGHEANLGGDDDEEDEDEDEEINSEEECEDVDAACRWFDGLIMKDSFIVKEVYSLHNVEFDRQELRKLVQKVQKLKEGCANQDHRAENAAFTKAKQTLLRFLRRLAKQSSLEA